MKHLFLASCAIFFVVQIQAQNMNLDYQQAFKFYSQTTYMDDIKSSDVDSNGNYSYSRSRTLRIFQPTIAFQWKNKKGNFHEIELTQFKINRNNNISEMKNANSGSSTINGGTKKTELNFAFRYEYIINFLKSKETKFVPSLGLGASPYFNFSTTDPASSTSYATSFLNSGLRVYLSPRITYYFHSKFFLDLNLPICLGDTYISRARVENPVFTPEQQVNTTIYVESFPKLFSGRIGLGYKF